MLTLKRARDRVEADHGIRFVNASLIGRIWKDQFDYQTDVLTTIALDDSNDEVESHPRSGRAAPGRPRRALAARPGGGRCRRCAGP